MLWSKLNWKLLTKKRGSSTQGLPPGKEDLTWVTNTVTLIYGDRDAVLVDTFLSEQQSRELLDWRFDEHLSQDGACCSLGPCQTKVFQAVELNPTPMVSKADTLNFRTIVIAPL